MIEILLQKYGNVLAVPEQQAVLAHWRPVVGLFAFSLILAHAVFNIPVLAVVLALDDLFHISAHHPEAKTTKSKSQVEAGGGGGRPRG